MASLFASCVLVVGRTGAKDRAHATTHTIDTALTRAAHPTGRSALARLVRVSMCVCFSIGLWRGSGYFKKLFCLRVVFFSLSYFVHCTAHGTRPVQSRHMRCTVHGAPRHETQSGRDADATHRSCYLSLDFFSGFLSSGLRSARGAIEPSFSRVLLVPTFFKLLRNAVIFPRFCLCRRAPCTALRGVSVGRDPRPPSRRRGVLRAPLIPSELILSQPQSPVHGTVSTSAAPLACRAASISALRSLAPASRKSCGIP